MLWNEKKAMVTPHCECTKCHRIVQLKMINFMLCEFHLNKNTIKELRAALVVSSLPWAGEEKLG